MNDPRTSSMLQRLTVILAVTAASYGLQVPVSGARDAWPAPNGKGKSGLPSIRQARQAGTHAARG